MDQNPDIIEWKPKKSPTTWSAPVPRSCPHTYLTIAPHVPCSCAYMSCLALEPIWTPFLPPNMPRPCTTRALPLPPYMSRSCPHTCSARLPLPPYVSCPCPYMCPHVLHLPSYHMYFALCPRYYFPNKFCVRCLTYVTCSFYTVCPAFVLTCSCNCSIFVMQFPL